MSIMGKKSALVAAVIASLCAFAGEAAAQNSGEYPLRLTGRPQVIPARTIRADGTFGVTRLSFCSTTVAGRICASGTGTSLNLGGAFGITNDLEVGATIAPLQLTEEFRYNDPSLYARYQFFHNGPLQVGVELAASIPVRSESVFQLRAGLPVWYNFTETVQLRTGLFYSVLLTDPDVTHGLQVPLVFNANFTDQVHGALITGVNLPFKDTGDTLSMPLGLEAGFVLANINNRPMVDLAANFVFPSFLVPGSSGDKVFTELWQIGVTGRFYIFM